ncbi:HNH endonuclease [Variovorax sp. ZT4R33]|uniref:HNH endonuclease n=1 Tax=Variovorax sp. ZT4R33 TaxID=3443743 RepID=UPI003F45EE67
MQGFDNTDGRMRGRKLQERRFRLWKKAKGCCALCSSLTAYPEGFQLDHKVPLFKGGEDADDNCQVLCVTVKGKVGCHDRKTADDMRQRLHVAIGEDGWPVG